jgi:carboxyl-terminal processing protease
MLFRRSFLITFLLVTMLAAAFGAGYLIRANQEAAQTHFPLLNEAYQVLETHGLKEIPRSPALEYGMIRGMVQAYDDPYTIFVPPAQHELESNALQGSYGGIGVSLGYDQEGNIELFPFPDSPARKAGIQDGDRLLSAGDLQVTTNTPLEDVQSAIRGPEGESVQLKIARPPDYKALQFKIVRAQFPEPSVAYHLDTAHPQVGVIQVNLIAASTVDEIQHAVQDMQTRGALYFILDLRDDPGGLLTAGVDTARLFLKDGVVIQQQYRGHAVEALQVEHPGPLVDIPLVVIINHGSASAAEIIAGALQSHHRALLVGSPSFGKDTIQLVFDLSDGSSLHVTSAHWWIPNLNPPLAGSGLQPDVPVAPAEDSAGPDPVLQAAIAAVLKSP